MWRNTTPSALTLAADSEKEPMGIMASTLNSQGRGYEAKGTSAVPTGNVSWISPALVLWVYTHLSTMHVYSHLKKKQMI